MGHQGHFRPRSTSIYQCTVESAGLPAALCMSERGNPRVKPEALSEDVFDVIGVNWLEIGVMSTFCDDDDCFTLPDFTVLHRKGP